MSSSFGSFIQNVSGLFRNPHSKSPGPPIFSPTATLQRGLTRLSVRV